MQPLLRACLLVALATCTPQQRPWVLPVAGGQGPFVAPSDRALRVVVEGNFPAASLHVEGRDAAGERRELAVVTLGQGRHEVGVPPGVTVQGLGLRGGCSGCLARCEVPAGLSARVVSVEQAAFWSSATPIPPRKVTLLRPGGHARFTVALAAAQLPAIELAVDSPRYLAGEPAFAVDKEHLVGRVQSLWLDSPGHYRALVVFRNGGAGQKTGPVTFSWSATAKLVGACPAGAASCAPPAAGPTLEGVAEECCRDGRESSGEDLVCKRDGEVKRVGPPGVAYCERRSEDAGKACSSSAECEGWCVFAPPGAGRCSASPVRPPSFESFEGGVPFKSSD